MGRYVWECDGEVEREVYGIYRVIMSKDASEYDVSKDRLGNGGPASLSSWILTP